MKLLIFTEGTIIMHPSKVNKSREERVAQSRANQGKIHAYRGYIPNGNAVEKLRKWKAQGTDIYYLTSRTTKKEIQDVGYVLSKYNFPDSKNLLFKNWGEEYKDVAERLMPNIIVEDDCESIGGTPEMTYPNMKPELKGKIASVVIKEFGGIDHLPDDLNSLKRFTRHQ